MYNNNFSNNNNQGQGQQQSGETREKMRLNVKKHDEFPSTVGTAYRVLRRRP